MQWKELEDYDWFPKILRQFQVEAIGYFVHILGLYKPVVSKVNELIHAHHITHMVDLCSGSGLPSLYIHKQLSHKVKLLLTDKYPQAIPNLNQGITYLNTPVDVLSVTIQPNTLYTMYNAFHHFTYAQKQSIITHFASCNAVLVIVEIVQPTIQHAISVILASTVLQLIVAPCIKPFSWLRLLYTYIIPINIITVLYDGVISVCKSKSVHWYRNFFNIFTTNTYAISTNSIYIQGTPILVITAAPIPTI